MLSPMSPIKFAFLFAATVAAQVTPSFRLLFFIEPGRLVGYVIGVEKQRTTIEVKVDEASGNQRNIEPLRTYTFDGTTRFELVATSFTDGEETAIITAGCTIPPEPVQPTCTFLANDFFLSRIECSPSQTGSRASVFIFGFCSSGTLKSIATTTLSESLIWVPVTITAGGEKLTASAGATPTTTGPKPTGTGETSGISTASERTGVAAPMRTMGPALVGLGAAMAALVM